MYRLALLSETGKTAHGFRMYEDCIPPERLAHSVSAREVWTDALPVCRDAQGVCTVRPGKRKRHI